MEEEADILDMDLEDAKKVLVETINIIEKEQLFIDLVSSGLLSERRDND